MSHAAVLDRAPTPIADGFEAEPELSAFDEALAVFPDSLSDLSLEEVMEARENVVNVLVSKGITTREQIDAGESHARNAGVTIDNAELLREDAYEIKDGQIKFESGVVQQVFDNWRTRIGEATALAGDNFKLEQKVDDNSRQIETAVGGSVDMMIRGLDMNIALAKKDPRFLSEVQSSLSDVKTELRMTGLMEKHPDREFVVFQTRPYVHTMLEKAGEEFVKRRHYSGEDEKTAMHFSFKIGGGSRSMMQTLINGDDLNIWDEVYGNTAGSDIDRLDNLLVVDVTDREVDHAEVHVLSVANIDDIQSRRAGELTHAGATVGTLEQRQAMYDQAIKQANQAEDNAIENSHRMTQLSIQVAESIITGEMSEEIKANIASALAAETSDGNSVLADKQRQLFEEVLATGELNERAASALQELAILQESARSTTDADRLASLLGAEEAAKVLTGKDIEAAALDAFAQGKRAGGCPGADDETMEEALIREQFETARKQPRTNWYDEFFNKTDIAELSEIERSVEREHYIERANTVFKVLQEALEADDVDILRQFFAQAAEEDNGSIEERDLSWGDKKPAKIRQVILLELLKTASSENEDNEASVLKADQVEETLVMMRKLFAADDSLSVDSAYEIWLSLLVNSTIGVESQSLTSSDQSAQPGKTETEDVYSEQVKRVQAVLDIVNNLAESDGQFEAGLNELFEDFYEELLSVVEESENQELIREVLEVLANPEARQEFAQEITHGLQIVSQQLAMDLLLEQISPETELLMIQILLFKEIDGESLFSPEEKQIISSTLLEGKLNEEAILIIRKYVLYQLLEPLIADGKVRIQFLSNPRALALVQVAVKNDKEESLRIFLIDRLVKTSSVIGEENNHKLRVKYLLGMFAVAGYKFARTDQKPLESLVQADEKSPDAGNGQLVFA